MAKLIVILVTLTVCASLAFANTEIRNFQVDPVSRLANTRAHASPAQLSSLDVILRTDVHGLNATRNEQSFRVRPAPLGTPLQFVCEPIATLEEGCPHEVWLQLDIGSAEWMHYNKFTLRLSWPAFVSSSPSYCFFDY